MQQSSIRRRNLLKYTAKTIALFLSLLITLSTVSCSKEDQSESNQNDTIDPPITNIDESGDTDLQNDITDIPEPETDIENVPEQLPEKIEEPINIFENETLESFYGNAAFVGDSVMHGLQLYSARGVTATTNSTFLTLTSFAARHALSDVSEKSYHPTYEGVKMKSEDALALSGVDKVFISLGLNDVRVTPKTYFENYVEFIGKIKEKCPDIKIFIISTTYPVESPNPNKMSRSIALDYRNQLHDLNTRLNEWCAENDAYFVDLMSPIMSENGFLADEYTSDNYVHLTNKAYTIWEQNLIDYATTLIETGEAPASFPEFTEVEYVEEVPVIADVPSDNPLSEEAVLTTPDVQSPTAQEPAPVTETENTEIKSTEANYEIQ